MIEAIQYTMVRPMVRVKVRAYSNPRIEGGAFHFQTQFPTSKRKRIRRKWAKRYTRITPLKDVTDKISRRIDDVIFAELFRK